MRFALPVVLAAGLASAAPSTQPVIAFLPPASRDVKLQQLGLLMVARASELTEETKLVNELHLKQVVRAIVDEGVTVELSEAKHADALRGLLGADRAITFTLETVGAQVKLSGWVVDGKKPLPFEARVPTAWSQALDQGSVALAKAMLPPRARLSAKSAAQPQSANDEALQALGECYPVVIRQPLSADTPTLIDTAELTRAVDTCARAMQLDPSLRFATAVHALGEAILGSDADAVKDLALLGDGDDMLELFTLARFWLLTRYQSNEAGLAFLKSVVARRPGELLAWSYLGDTQLALGQWADAEATWRTYTTQVPRSAWAWGRLSKALARQKKFDDALAAAKKGFALSPISPEATLELGSRLIDAGQLAEAQALLEPLARLQPPRGEYLVRLGWAHYLENELDPAAAYFQRALDVATAPGEWRTRGRAAYDLALVEVKRNRPDAARAALRAMMLTGLKLKDVDPALTPLIRELERGEVERAGAPKRPTLVPKESSLFPVDDFGEPDPAAKKPPAPNGLVLYRF